MIILCQIINRSVAGLLSKIQRCNQRTAKDRNPPKSSDQGQTACNSLPSCKRKSPIKRPQNKGTLRTCFGTYSNYNYHSYLHLHFPAHPACILRGVVVLVEWGVGVLDPEPSHGASGLLSGGISGLRKRCSAAPLPRSSPLSSTGTPALTAALLAVLNNSFSSSSSVYPAGVNERLITHIVLW